MNKNDVFIKITEELKKVNVKCKCGHSINITNKYKRLICNVCGKMVYLDKEEEKKNEFRNKLRRMLRNG